MAASRISSRRLLCSRIVYLRPHTVPRRATLAQSTPPYTALLRHISTSRRQGQGVQAFHSQLEDTAAASSLSFKATPLVPQTLTEKIVQRYAVGLPDGKYVKAGDYISLQPHKIMTHDNSWPVAMKFISLGATKIHDPSQIVMTLDHDVQNESETNLRKYRNIEEFAQQQGVDFYPAGRGIGHQIMVEEGYAWPGTLCVASDSHSPHYGGVGCLGTAVVRTDSASIWATGKTWWQIPPVAKVTFTGELPVGVTGKDVIVSLCALFKNDEVLNHAIEYSGSEETMRSIPVDDRCTIANMTTEWGGLSGLFPIDSTLKGWLRAKATEYAIYGGDQSAPSNTVTRFNHQRLDELFEAPITADPGATYAKHLTLNLSTLSPYVSGPNSVKVATPLAELQAQDIKVDRAYLVSCTNSRRTDIAAAAKVFKDAAKANGGVVPKIPEHVSFYISAASLPEQKAAEEQGDWQALLEAGAHALPAACGACIGLGVGLLEPGEVGISSSNRNYKGRMGSTAAKAYLASPEVVAASALQGKIAGPGWYQQPAGWAGVEMSEGEPFEEKSVDEVLGGVIMKLESIVHSSSHLSSAEGVAEESKDNHLTELYPGFPEKIKGELVFCDADNLNTDGIYPGKYTYQDYVPTEKMAEICMENFDPTFSKLAKPGDILVSGFNFGCGSSREQAATAILAKGIPLVIAGSFGNIFSRNAINNALMGVEVPKLIQRLREVFASSSPNNGNGSGEKILTRRTGWTLEWDIRRSKVIITEGDGKSWSQRVGELPPDVQEVIASGGLENWVKAQIGT